LARRDTFSIQAWIPCSRPLHGLGGDDEGKLQETQQRLSTSDDPDSAPPSPLGLDPAIHAGMLKLS